MSVRPATPAWHLFVPKLYTVLQRGYGWTALRDDLLAGLTVAIVALPLAMALAIASGTTPEKGLHTAIVAGFLISLLGGSRVQIGGPTAAFIPVVFGVIERFGYGGLILCTLLAGLMLIAAGVLRLGTLMKYMPKPVVTGFTAGIAVSIFSSQVKDLLGLSVDKVPAEFIARWEALIGGMGTINPWAPAVAAASIAVIVVMRRWKPTSPSMLMAVAGASVVVALGQVPVETLAMRFPEGIPATLPQFDFPTIPFERTGELLPSAFTIAFLAGVESLLSAVVADGMTGGRHRSNCELVAQGVANCASALVGGLPATGAIARTATNIRAGARTPVAGMLHAVFLLAFMLLLAPAMGYVPLAALAGVLLIVAWNMAEIEAIRHLSRGPVGDQVVLWVTFALTVAFDLTIAIEVGVVLAAFLFMHRMAGVVAVDADARFEDADDLGRPAAPDQRADLPPGVEVYQVAGPLFFAVADRLDEMLDQFFSPPAVLILRLRLVPMIDASGVAAFTGFLDRAHRLGIRVVLSGLQAQPRAVLARMHALDHPAIAADVTIFDEAVPAARRLVGAD
jgi:SulP family sulfate permease